MLGQRAEQVRQNRARIAAAAMDLFASNGFDSVTVAAVATAAGVTEKTVFNHFGTKEDLVFDRADEFGDALVAAVAERRPGVPAFDALRHHLLEVYAAFPGRGATRHLVLSRMIAGSVALQAREQRIIAGYAQRLATALQGTGDELDLTPQVVADAVMGVHRAVIGAYRQAALDGQKPATYGPRTLVAARAAFQMLADGLAAQQLGQAATNSRDHLAR